MRWSRCLWALCASMSVAVTAVAGGPAGQSSPAAAPTRSVAETAVRTLWTHLPATTNHCEGTFDYFPRGGLRILWCHAREDLSLAQVAVLAGTPVWVSGPHQRRKGLDLENLRAFGHYDPAFVRTLPSFALPGATDDAFRIASQPTYDKVLKERARLAWRVHAKLMSNPECAERERAAYQADMRSSTPTQGYYERWYGFLDPAFCTGEGHGAAGMDGNVTKTLTAWWLRRTMDGTASAWHDALRALLAAYDAEFLASPGGVRRGE
ncbi:MAG: hypothetical protein ACI8PZ_004961 [Myxococcota bacterium]|jgi:hypothetical protein